MGDPYRTPQVPPEEQPAGPDLDPEITTREGHRTRSLLVEEKALAEGGEQKLEIRELIRCDECKGKGCSVCAQRGATIKKSAVVIRWDAGTEDGHAVTLEGRGDVPGLRRDVIVRTFPEGRGDLLVRVGTKKKLVRSIENAERRRQRRQRAFLDERAATRSLAVARMKRTALALAVLLVGLGGLAGVAYLKKNPVGDPCGRSDDCRSGLCLESTMFTLGSGASTTKVCSQKCVTDADCSSGLSCTEVDLDDGFSVGRKIRACGHR